jgi:nicotinate-nucleotide--dimethylbenzimidazole phosphoribosyltransferase
MSTETATFRDAPIQALCAHIAEIDPAVAARTQALLDGKTKPRRSLGRLEELACRIAAIRGEDTPPFLPKAIVVMAADHGVAEEGVSAYPQEVTAQMALNFAQGGAAINVLAQQADARVVVVDMGIKAPLTDASVVRDCRVGPGTKNFAREPAMSRFEAMTAIDAGATIASELAADGIGLIGIGEMGIGNTTSASAMTAVLTGAPPEEVTGRGTGIDDTALRKKIEVIKTAIALHHPDAADPLGVLSLLGGFEIAGLAGVVLGAAGARIPVVVDGFIASVAALCAVRIEPRAAAYLLPSHRSVEVGHRLVLKALQLEPLFDLDLRLGEGTGAALAMSLCDSSLAVLNEMATFASAGVSDTGR